LLRKTIFMEENISVVTVEMDAWEWFCAVIQKGNKILEKVKDHKTMTDEDHAWLKIFYRIWDNGELPIYRQQMEGKADNSTQSDIFGQLLAEDTTEDTDGTDIDNTVLEPINEQKND